MTTTTMSVSDILNPTVKPSREDLFALNDIDDPIERGWAAKQLALRAERFKLPTIEARAITAMEKAVDKVIDQYETIQPLDVVVDDLPKRGWLAQMIMQRTKQRAAEHRDLRDKAGLTLIAPFVAVVRPLNEERRQLTAAKDAGEIPKREYYTRLEDITKRRREALEAANIKVQPQDVYKKMGITRGRFIQMMEEMPPAGIPRMQNAMDVLDKQAPIVARLVEIGNEVRPHRTETLTRLLKLYANLDVHRLTGMSTARVAQIRKGTKKSGR